MEVSHKIETLVVLLKSDVLADGPEIIPDMQFTRWLDTAEHSFILNCFH
jgi:hypothetical protein